MAPIMIARHISGWNSSLNGHLGNHCPRVPTLVNLRSGWGGWRRYIHYSIHITVRRVERMTPSHSAVSRCQKQVRITVLNIINHCRVAFCPFKKKRRYINYATHNSVRIASL